MEGPEMRLAFGSSLLVGLLCTLAIPAMAMTPPDLVVLDEDTRIVLPQAGMAVTVPAGWEVRTGYGGAIIETAMSASPSGAPGECGIQVFRFDGATARDVAEFLGGSYWDLKGFETTETRLPSAGDAVRLESPGGARALAHTRVAYIFDAGDRYAWLWCDSTSAAPPDDLWLSIADTVEFLPEEASASPEPPLGSPAGEPTEPPSVGGPGSELASVLASLPGARPEVETWSGPEWIARLDPILPADPEVIRRVGALVAAADASLDDLTIATALFEPRPGNIASVATLRIPGMRAFDLLDPVIAAMEPQIAAPAISWHRSADHLIARVYDATMPGVYPVTLYPLADTIWVIGADLPLVETIVGALPTQLGSPSGPVPMLPCDALAEAFQRDPGAGNTDLDRDYLTRCTTCDELLGLVNFHRVADVEMGLDILARRCDWHPAGEPTPLGSPGPLGTVLEGGRIEMEGSGFTITVPSDWAVQVAVPDVDHATQPPGTAWEALRASAPDGAMACTLSVGVAEVSLRRGSGTSVDRVRSPFWDPTEASRLWVPTPDVPDANSSYTASFDRLGDGDAGSEPDVQYALVCAADDTRVEDPDRIVEQVIDSFEFLPEE